MSALSGIRIVELSESVAGEYCGKLLADFGADVIKIETPGWGSPTRAVTQSTVFAYLNTNKRSVELDLAHDHETLNDLIASAHAVIDHHTSSAELAGRHPDVVFCSITPFGQGAPPDLQNSKSLNVFHASGWGYHTPSHADRALPPLKGPGRFLADYEAGLDAALCVASSLFAQLHHGHGEFIDLSAHAVLVSRADCILGRFITGEIAPENTRDDYDQQGPASFFGCRDGHVYLYMTSRSHWGHLKELMGYPRWLDDFDDDWLEFSVTPEKVAMFHRGFADWVRDQNKHTVADTAQRLGVPLVPVNGAAVLRRSPQYRHRGFFRDVTHPMLGTAAYPTVPYRMSGTPAQIDRPAPALGAHTEEVLDSLRVKRQPVRVKSPHRPRRRGAVPWRVCGWSNSPRYGRALRGQTAGVPGRRSDQGGKREHARGDAGIRRHRHQPRAVLPEHQPANPQREPRYQDAVRTRSITPVDRPQRHRDQQPAARRHGAAGVGLRRPQGHQVRHHLRLDQDVGQRRTARLPDRLRTVLRSVGRASLVGYPGGPPLGASMRYGDSTVGAAAAFAAVAALLHRELTGEGQFVDVSAVEVLSSMIGDALLEQSSTGSDLVPDGNRHPDMAPHGCYPCSGADWIAIAVADDAEWRRLCDVLEAGKLADDPRYALSRDRIANADRLDAALTELTTAHNAAGLAQRLRHAGVAANKSATSIDVIGDELLWERGFYRFVSDHREGQRPVLGPPWRMSRASARIERGAPDLGEDNEYVFNEVLGKVTP